MTDAPGHPVPLPPPSFPVVYAPFLRAPEASHGIFRVICLAACAPLAAGVFFFGWRALMVAAICVATCVVVEGVYYRVTRTPSLLGRSHAALTGLLLALTLPANVPWYVPLAGALFAIIVGKALFGGVGHFLWQPALVGRLAVAVLFAPPLLATRPLSPDTWPLLSENHVILGDVAEARAPIAYWQWHKTPPPPDADAFLLPRPEEALRGLGLRPSSSPTPILSALRQVPPPWDILCGAHPGGIGETCAIAIVVAGMYLVYRHYVRASLPGLFLLGAAVTAAVAPLPLEGGAKWQWLPLLSEGIDVGLTYVLYLLASGELLLAAWFMATEMTSRPVTAPAQALFGLSCGVLAMLMSIYLNIALPAYAAVLIGNTFTPLLDRLVRPRPLGMRRWWQRRRKYARTAAR